MYKYLKRPELNIHVCDSMHFCASHPWFLVCCVLNPQQMQIKMFKHVLLFMFLILISMLHDLLAGICHLCSFPQWRNRLESYLMGAGTSAPLHLHHAFNELIKSC